MLLIKLISSLNWVVGPKVKLSAPIGLNSALQELTAQIERKCDFQEP